jgi:hypothetical protein
VRDPEGAGLVTQAKSHLGQEGGQQEAQEGPGV